MLSSNRLIRLLALGLTCATALACTDELPPIEGTTSLRIKLTAPAALGTPEVRLPDTERSIAMTIEALDTTGEIDTTFSGPADIYSHFLSSLTPSIEQAPLQTAQLTNGVSGPITFDLPLSYGATFLWVENVTGENATFATGTSDTLWYREPFIEDISRPVDEMALDALEASPLELKQVVIAGSRYGDRGRMMATGVYAQGYTVSDVECQDANGTPPCVTGDYDHIFVFSFSRPEDQAGRSIQVGQVIDQFSGGVSEFNGLTEIGFPSSVVNDTTVNTAMLPEPVVIDPSWLTTRIEMERVEAALVAVEGATMCPLDEDFQTFGQWKLDVGFGCQNNNLNFISTGVAPSFDPGMFSGQTIPRVVGTLRPINIGSFHVWIIFPRGDADITAPPAQ